MIVCCFLPVPGPLCFCLRLCLRCVLLRPHRAGSPLVIDTRLAQSPVIGTGGGCKHWLEGGNEALTLSSVSGSSGGGCLCLSSSFHLSTFQRTPLAKLYSCYLDSGTTGFSPFFFRFFLLFDWHAQPCAQQFWLPASGKWQQVCTNDGFVWRRGLAELALIQEIYKCIVKSLF